jgi:sulfatase maturation enzyme AslB (radical SAM superfamily)
LPFLAKNYYLNFYGGEPLLSFDSIKKTISLLNSKNKELNKKPHFSITTNGSLLSEEVIQFLNTYKFSVELSFDGLAQEVHRNKGSFEKIVSSIKELLKYTDMNLEVNSVFTPETVSYLSKSIQFIMDLNVPNIHFSLSTIKPWDRASLLKLEKELIKLRKIVLAHYERNGNNPVVNFIAEKRKGIFSCSAGKDRLAITPEGGIWGCYLFPDYFRGKENTPQFQKFYFGTLDDFIKNYKNIYPLISSNYAQLSMDNFSTSSMKCFLCSDLENCEVCPINASFSGVPLGKIPNYTCEIRRIMIREKGKFRKEFQGIISKYNSFG